MSKGADLTFARLRRQSYSAIAPKIRYEAKDRRPFEVPSDFVEFAGSCQIRSGSEYVPFRLYDYQIELAKLIDQYRRIAIFKTRQLGATEEILCKMLHRSLSIPGYLGAVLSIGQDESSKCSQRVQTMPTMDGFQWETESLKALQAKGCGQLLFRPSTPNAVRSLPSVTDLMFDEADFIFNIEEAYAGATPAQKMAGANAKTYVVSTMSESGELGWFWQLFSSGTPKNIDLQQRIQDIRDGKGECGGGLTWWVDDSGWCKVLMHWKSHPIYSSIPNYLEITKLEEKLTEAKLQREYNLGIPKAGGALFSHGAIARQAVGQWQSWQYGHRYIVGIDPNFGGSDFWRTQVWDVTNLPHRLVAEYGEQDRTVEYSKLKTLELIDAYKPLMVAIEANSGGVPIMEWLIQKRPHIPVEKIISSHTSKRINTDRIAIAVEQGDVIYPEDWDGISEMKLFSLKDRCATSGYDDAVMAFAVTWAILDKVPPPLSYSGDSVDGDRSIMETLSLL